ncbi:MAG TPA: hypothetical protein VGW39_16370 [Chthoniobacterales bacterium]|nr:hypothetical protein [Chthoniobacterales bacterium]
MAASMRATATFAVLVAALLLAGCGGTDRRHSISPAGTTSVPPYLELRSKISAGTLHFRPGLYVLDSEDGNGYYYRAPRKIVQRSFAGGYPRDGGIFVSKRDQKKLRGYVIMPGGLTHVGNLSRADYEFRY